MTSPHQQQSSLNVPGASTTVGGDAASGGLMPPGSPILLFSPAEMEKDMWEQAIQNVVEQARRKQTEQLIEMEIAKRRQTEHLLELESKRRQSEHIAERAVSVGQHMHTSHHPGSRADHGKVVLPHEVSLADDWSTPKQRKKGPSPQQPQEQKVRSGSFSHGTTSGDRTVSVGSKSQVSALSGPGLFDSYPSSRNISGQVVKQVDFLTIQPGQVHEVPTQNQAGRVKMAEVVGGKRRGSITQISIHEKHPRLINNIYRADLSLKYELLVPPKKATKNIVSMLSRIFARTAGVVTHGSRSDAERLVHLPEVVVVQNENATGSGSGTRPTSAATATAQSITVPRSGSTHNIFSPPRSRIGSNTSQKPTHLTGFTGVSGEFASLAHESSSIGVASSRLQMKDDSFAADTLPPSNSILDRLMRLGSTTSGTLRLGSISGEQTSLLGKFSRANRPSVTSPPVHESVAQGVGFVLSALPPPPSKSPLRSSAAERPESPHILTPTRTGGSMSSGELDASTPDRYLENASAFYVLQPISVNTFRRLRPSSGEVMSFRYIDRTSSLSLCVSGTDHSADLEEQRTLDDDVEGGDGTPRSGGGESGSLMSGGDYGEYGTASMIQTHKRALVYQGGEWLINNPDRTVYTLLYTKNTKVGMKDFAVDFRAQMDTDRLLTDAVVILDTTDSHIYRIIQHLVTALVDKDFEATGRGNDAMRKARCKEEAMRNLFVDKSVTVLSRAIQGGCLSEMLDDTLDIQMARDQIWICAFAQLHDMFQRHVAFCRTSGPVNMGNISEELKFVVLVMTPTVEKSTKSALETARTFATLFLDVETRNQLSGALDQQEFRDVLIDHANRLHAIQEHPELVRRLTQKRASRVYFKSRCLSWYPGQGIYLDIKRRWPYYKSDYTDGLRGPNTVHKLLSTIVFLYFAVLLPTLAFGVLNDSNTAGKIGVEKHIFAQVFGGLMFGIFGGQPLLVIMTTAPLGLYMRILYSIANQFQVDFFAFYSCIGLWNCFFLSIYALLNTSCLTNLCTRTIQDIFEMFALFAFVVDGLTELMHNFGEHYFSEACSRQAGSRSGFWALTGNAIGPAESSSSTSSSTTTSKTTTTDDRSLLGFTSTIAPAFEFFSYLTGKVAKRSVEATNGSLLNESLTSGLPTIFSATNQENSTTTTTTAATTIIQLINQALNDTTTSMTPATSTLSANASDFFSTAPTNIVGSHGDHEEGECRRDRALLYLLLMLATWWSSLRLHGFAKTPYTNKNVREFLADYSLPIAIIAVSIVGRLVFGDVQLEQFTIYDYRPSRARFENLPLWCIFVCGGIGFIISLLFFFDTTITNSVVCRPTNKLKKGTTYDYDLLIVALINGFLSLFALPWLYPTTPQSPLHLMGLADVEERVDAGHVYQAVVRVRETRLTTIVASVMIGLSLFMLPYPLAYISRPVLNGLFLYMAAMSIHDNQLMERIMLLFTEQTAYPPHHYIRTVPQRQLHMITMIQIFQLVVICGMGLYGRNIYVEMLFPIVLCLMFPVRHSLMPKIIDIKYLESLEGLKSSQVSKRAAPAFEM